MSNEIEKLCPGCQHPDLHKMCPAYGTPYYMSGEKLPDEIYSQRAGHTKPPLNEPLGNAINTASHVVDCDNELSRHLLILTLSHLDKISEGDKEKLIKCWNEILEIELIQIPYDNRFDDDIYVS